MSGPGRVIVEEVVIVEECGSDEEGEWELGEDGNWYCTVDEYYEEEIVSPKQEITTTVIPKPQNTVFKTAVPTKRLETSSANGTPSPLTRSQTDIVISPRNGPTASSAPEITTPREATSNDHQWVSTKPKDIETILQRSQSTEVLSRKKIASTSSANSSPKSKSPKSSRLHRKIIKKKGKYFCQTVYGEPLKALIETQQVRGIDSKVPQIVQWTVEYIKENGMDTSGLFRLCGHHSLQLQKEELINQWCSLEELQFNEMDIHTVAALLKSFLRALPSCIVPRQPVFALLVQVSAFSDLQTRLKCYKAILNSIEKWRYHLLRYLLFFLHDVASHADKNLMSSANLSLIFAPSFLGTLDNDENVRKETIDPFSLCKETKFIAMITQELIDHVHNVMEEESPKPSVYRANECFKPSLPTHVAVLRGDIFIVLSEQNDEITVLISDATGRLPSSFLQSKGVEKSDISLIKTKEISSFFTNKIVPVNRSTKLKTAASSARSAEMISLLKGVTKETPRLSTSGSRIGEEPEKKRRTTFSKMTTDVLRFSPSIPKRNSMIIAPH